MSIRTLFAIVIALAVLLSPAGQAFAAVPDHHMQMTQFAPCQMPPAKSGDHGKMDKNCCMAMCMTVAVAPSAPADVADQAHAFSYFSVPKSWHGYLGEIATPPPRIA